MAVRTYDEMLANMLYHIQDMMITYHSVYTDSLCLLSMYT